MIVTYEIEGSEYQKEVEKENIYFKQSNTNELLKVYGTTNISNIKLPKIATIFENVYAEKSKIKKFHAWVENSAEFIDCPKLIELFPDIEIRKNLKFKNCGIISLNHILPNTEIHQCKNFKEFSNRTQFRGSLSLIKVPKIKGIYQPIPGKLTVIDCKSFEFLGKDFKCGSLETDKENAKLFIRAFYRINNSESQRKLLELCNSTTIAKNFKLKELLPLTEKYPEIKELNNAFKFKQELDNSKYKITKKIKELKFLLKYTKT